MLAALEWSVVKKQAGLIAAGAAFETACNLLEAWAQDELDDPLNSAIEGFWQGTLSGLRNFALGTALGWGVEYLSRKDYLVHASTAVGKAFSWLAPAGPDRRVYRANYPRRETGFPGK